MDKDTTTYDETEGLYIHSKCHIESPTWCVMQDNQQMLVICAKCGKPIARFFVLEAQAAVVVQRRGIVQ